MKKIAIFASGAGSNAREIIQRAGLSKNPLFEVSLIASNRDNAAVLNLAREKKIATLVIDREKFFEGNGYVDELKAMNIDFVVLAGFLWKIPDSLIAAFPNKIINIHPALLPKYGGKGMYGRHVHQAIIDNKEKESGITIHYVDGHYDNGDIIFQATCAISEDDTPESLAKKVQELEHKYYYEIVEKVVGEVI